jgi:hypothetical protein
MNLKKLMTMLVLGLFVLGMMPLAFAEHSEGEAPGADHDDAAEGADEGSDSDTGAVTSARDGARPPVAVRPAIRKAAANVRRAEDTLREAREKVLKARQRVIKTREDFQNARERVKDARSATPADKKEFLLSAADRILDHLTKLHERVEGSDLENKDGLLVELEAIIADVEAAKAKIEALGEGATREEIKAAVQELRESWKEAKDLLKRGAHRVVHKRIGLVVKQMEKLNDKLERIIAKMQEKGVDTSSVDSLMTDFDARLDSAETHLGKAKELFDAGSVPESNAEVRLAHADLKEAHRIVKEILKKLRGLRPGALGEAEKEAEVEAPEEEHEADEDDASEDADDAAEDGTDTGSEDSDDNAGAAPSA